MIKDEALKLALEALELHGKQYPHMVKGYCLDAITAIKEALANEALEKMAENARELGLDYEPEQTEHGWTPERIAGMARLKEAQDKKMAQQEQPKVRTGNCLRVGVCASEGHKIAPQRKPLTDEEIWEALGGIDCTRPMLIARAIESAHGIKG